VTPRELLLANLDTIRRSASFVTAQAGLEPQDREDFESFVKLRLIENDYAVLRGYSELGSLRGYLQVVIRRLFIDFERRRLGRWRSSATARRLGPVAVELETLLYRDGCLLEEATRLLTTRTKAPAKREELLQIWEQLPLRPRLRMVSLESVRDDPADEAWREVAERRVAVTERVVEALREELDRLGRRDRLFLYLRFEQGLASTQIARLLGMETRAARDRLKEIVAALRRRLETAGVDAAVLPRLLMSQVELGLGGPAPGQQRDALAALSNDPARRTLAGDGP